MLRKVLKAMRSQKGFTLIELLVVIGILAAIAGVTVLAVTQFIGRGECEACTTEVHQCQTAAAAYWVEAIGNPASGYDTSTISTCGDLIGSTLLTDMKYGDAWTINADGVVSGDCTAACSP
jgi:prepilin-type N-terminal cleavage/methylation domain-containing protein